MTNVASKIWEAFGKRPMQKCVLLKANGKAFTTPLRRLAFEVVIKPAHDSVMQKLIPPGMTI